MPGNIQFARRVMMKGMIYRTPIAISGVMSNIPSLGTTLLNGDKIGSVISSSNTIKMFCLFKLNQDNTTRAKTAYDKMRQK